MLNIIGKIFGAVLMIGLGFYLRGFVPSGDMMMGMPGMGGMPPPAVTALELKELPLDLQDEYIAAVEPVQSVMVRTEVSGYIGAVHFREGSMVEEGDLLFTIDPQQYRALVEVREAELKRARAELTHAEKFLKRMQGADRRSVSQSDLDKAESDQLQAVAGLKQAEANLNLAKIDLGYSEVRAPISGRIGAALATRGNYVTPGSEPLARIVQINPMRVVFSMPDRAYLDLAEKEQTGQAGELVARVRLPNGSVLPTVGKKDFADNQMDAQTGTLAVRYLFENRDNLLIPGGYVNILLGQPERPMGLRVPQQAILADEQGSYVLTVNAEGEVSAARVELGKVIETDREVLSGLKAGDRVVVEGVQKVKPGAKAVVTLQEAKQ